MGNYNKRHQVSLSRLRKTRPDSLYHKADFLKARIFSKIDNITTNQWVDFTGFELVYGDIITDYLQLRFDADNKTFEISRNGIYEFGGSVHVQNNTTGNIEAEVLLRGLVNNHNEIIDSQYGTIAEMSAGGEETLNFVGTHFFYKGDTFKLQYYTDSSDISFYSSSDFDNQVAVTLHINYLGGKTR